MEQARAAAGLDRIVVSSDDERVLELARRYDDVVAMVRPDALARDDTPSADVLRHALGKIEDPFDLIVLLQPTSPLRLAQDIDDALVIARQSDAASCISVAPASGPGRWLMRDDGSGRLISASASGGSLDQTGLLVPNGAVFVIDADWLMAGNDFYSAPPAYHLMPPERSIDIDELDDFVLAEALGATLLPN